MGKGGFRLFSRGNLSSKEEIISIIRAKVQTSFDYISKLNTSLNGSRFHLLDIVGLILKRQFDSSMTFCYKKNGWIQTNLA